MKIELLSQLENAKNNFILVLGAISLFSNEKSHPILNDSNCKFGIYTIEFKQISNLMGRDRDREIACKELVNMGLRALIKETFELIKEYSKETQQEEIFKSQSWYHFARIIRNCLSHNFKFKLEKDKKLLPITWRGRTIDVTMDNQDLMLSFFGYVEAWELFNEMSAFVKSILR